LVGLWAIVLVLLIITELYHTMEANPHALDSAQDPNEVFEIMEPPPANFDPHADFPTSTASFITREVCHKQGLWHCSVHIWIVDTTSSSILLQKRSMKKDTFPGRWDISSAGHVEKGKSILETAGMDFITFAHRF